MHFCRILYTREYYFFKAAVISKIIADKTKLKKKKLCWLIRFLILNIT